MRFIVTLFWSVVIGLVVGYIMTALAGVAYNPLWTVIVAAVFAVFMMIFQAVAIPDEKKAE